MSKTTITICGEEYLVLPAQRGTFLLFSNFYAPYFVHYLAVNVNNPIEVYICDFEGEGVSCGIKKTDKFKICHGVDIEILKTMEVKAKRLPEYDGRTLVMSLYQIFKSYGTPMDLSAIHWFKKKFIEHNITKADFDVFA